MIPIQHSAFRLQHSHRFPVVIGEGSHPFPFRTRKLSSLPPMVLHAQVCGRVGHCRDYSFKKSPTLYFMASGFFLVKAKGTREKGKAKGKGKDSCAVEPGRYYPDVFRTSSLLAFPFSLFPFPFLSSPVLPGTMIAILPSQGGLL